MIAKAAAAETPQFTRVIHAEDGVGTPWQNGRPTTSDYMDRLVTDDMPGEVRERIQMAIIYPVNGD